MFIYKLCFKIWSHCQGFVLTHSNQLGKTKGKQKQTSNIHTTLKYSVYELKHLKTVVVNFILGKKSKQFHYIIVITISQSKWLNPDRNINRIKFCHFSFLGHGLSEYIWIWTFRWSCQLSWRWTIWWWWTSTGWYSTCCPHSKSFQSTVLNLESSEDLTKKVNLKLWNFTL